MAEHNSRTTTRRRVAALAGLAAAVGVTAAVVAGPALVSAAVAAHIPAGAGASSVLADSTTPNPPNSISWG